MRSKYFNKEKTLPISTMFKQRLYWRVPEIAQEFGTPFHIYDERGITEGAQRLNGLFSGLGFREYFAVKACPNLRILKILFNQGFGFDCSSIPELVMARMVGARSYDIMFTSNNTTEAEYREAASNGGCILNLDDISFIDKVPEPFPDLICFRYNPGSRRQGNAIIGEPEEAKYGLRHDQIVAAYQKAKQRGAVRFGLHTMVVSNERKYLAMVETIEMLLNLVQELQNKLGIGFEFINIGGGIGIPYHPVDHQSFDLDSLAKEARELLSAFKAIHIDAPNLFMESGRWVTGPHGVLVTKVTNVMSKYRDYVGVDACMSALMRPAMYGAYHHLTVVDKDGAEKQEVDLGLDKVVDVVGSLCENNDKFAVQRHLPIVVEDDFLVIHDTGAHGIAMGFQYNGRLRPAELLLRTDGSVELIRRSETTVDYLQTQLDFQPQILK